MEEACNQVAVRRGPVVYCLESVDLPAGVGLGQVAVPLDIELGARFDPRLLQGVTVLEGAAVARHREPWGSKLYREIKSGPTEEITLRLIPYYAWANRGPSEMSVWLPRQ